ncbi:MAG: hypothetical protein H6Q28_1581 [Bacteroidetes bacterium]|nr:hypothetical protein [Bacteroidota bacterium]
MPDYALSTVRKEGYLHAVVTGRNSAENVRAYLADVHRACEESRCPRVLIEEHLEGPSLRVIDVFQIIREASQKAWPVIKKIAYVDTHPGHFAENMRFAETVASNLGVYVRVFDSVQKAEAWIRESAEGAR